MRTIGNAVRTMAYGTALMLMALPEISAAAEHGGMQHGDHADKKGSATFSHTLTKY